MVENCILCGEPLSAYPTNREHYVPQVLIRNFGTLCINPKYDWAIRQNNYNLSEDYLSVPITAHKKWAVIEVHEKCNLKAAAMCRDLRYIIDHLDTYIDNKYFMRPIKYYANLWNIPYNSLVFSIITKEQAIKEQTDDFTIIYKPGLLNCGRIRIFANTELNDYYHHTISLGCKSNL